MADPNPQQNVTFPSNGGEAHGYLALPPSGSGPGLVVIQEWWGLTSHMVSTSDRFAAEGFVVLAPDLFGGTTTHDATEAERLMTELPEAQATQDLAGAVDYLLGRSEVTGDALGTVGFCMGGGFVLSLAAQQGRRIAAAVPFYGVVSELPDFTGLTAAVLGHYGEADDFIPLDNVRDMETKMTEQSGRAPDIKLYPAGHAFMNDENLLGTYDPDQAKVAWERTIAFLHEHLG
ncbi:MAG: dienelactone hydrolase family protein [Actinomycetota bacterium]|nr:dienelactone hydrolase family protein [Actinomycetota bacterium]